MLSIIILAFFIINKLTIFKSNLFFLENQKEERRFLKQTTKENEKLKLRMEKLEVRT